MYLKALLIWVLIATVEVIHGILRAKFLAPKVGDFRSRQIGVVTGSILIFIITFFTLEWIGVSSPLECFALGLVWFLLMFVFEMLLGHFVFHFPWKWLLNDFNFLKGRLLLFGMIFLALAPYLVWQLRISGRAP